MLLYVHLCNYFRLFASLLGTDFDIVVVVDYRWCTPNGPPYIDASSLGCVFAMRFGPLVDWLGSQSHSSIFLFAKFADESSGTPSWSNTFAQEYWGGSRRLFHIQHNAFCSRRFLSIFFLERNHFNRERRRVKLTKEENVWKCRGRVSFLSSRQGGSA